MTTLNEPLGRGRAAVQQRCADAFLHEIRGSLQALFGALELLCRVARDPGNNSDRADKACELARRAIGQHEKTTLDLFRLLTFQADGVRMLDLRALTDEVLRLFRNDLANRQLSVRMFGLERIDVAAERGALHAAVAALLSVAIDSSPSRSQLGVVIEETPDCAVLTVQATLAAAALDGTVSRQLLMQGVRDFLADSGGALQIAVEDAGQYAMRLTLPRASRVADRGACAADADPFIAQA